MESSPNSLNAETAEDEKLEMLIQTNSEDFPALAKSTSSEASKQVTGDKVMGMRHTHRN